MIADFRELNIADIFLDADPDLAPEWGTMHLHAMVEHLTEAVKYSNGRLIFTIPTNIPDYTKAFAFLESPYEYPRNFPTVLEPKTAQNLRFIYFEDAVMDLIVNVTHFDVYFDRNPDSCPFHPYFGALNKEHWLMVHNKHFTHHLKQFKLI